MATNSISSYSHKGVREATFAHPNVAEPIGVFNLSLLRTIDSKLANRVIGLWEDYAVAIEKHNETRLAELEGEIDSANSECRKLSAKLDKAQAISTNAKMASINADVNVDASYRTIGNVRSVALPKFPTQSERDEKAAAIAESEKRHLLALHTQKQAEVEFTKHARAIVEIAKTFQVAVNLLDEKLDEFRRLSGGTRHELDQRNPRDIKRMEGLPV